MTDSDPGPGPDARKRGISEGPVERLCKYLSSLALIVLLVIVGVDIVTRWGFNFSYEISDEVGAYMLVAITFLSLPVSHINGIFHHVEFVQARLSERWKVVSRIVFELLALLCSGALLWQFIRLVQSSRRYGDYAPTMLETPLWVPRLLLVVGMAALCVSLCRSLAADMTRLRRGGEETSGQRDGA
jgi:TRAP-type C4-dicarboxylate transport system permease small subunit